MLNRNNLQIKLWLKQMKWGLIPRYRPAVRSVNGTRIAFVDFHSFVHQYRDIFQRETYRIPDPGPNATMIDCGTNIGLASAWLAREYPAARIIGYEADPKLVEVATDNARSFGVDNVELVNAAVWVHDDGVEFATDLADAGAISTSAPNRVSVPSVRLATKLQEYNSVAFLKLDIEGAEFAVIEDCRTELGRVRSMFVEVHADEQTMVKVPTLLSCLIEAGFSIQVEPVRKAGRSPLTRKRLAPTQINLYCTRLT